MRKLAAAIAVAVSFSGAASASDKTDAMAVVHIIIGSMPSTRVTAKLVHPIAPTMR